MKKQEFKFGDYLVRLINIKDIENYYKYAILNSDEEARYYTGTIGVFTKDSIVSYIEKIINDSSRYDFLIIDADAIVGEVVISEIDNRNCHYRICIFNKTNFSKKIGLNATNFILEFIFDKLNLQTVELEVFPFNVRGIGLYQKLGFKEIKRIKDEEAIVPYKEIILMRLNSSDYYKNSTEINN